MKKKDIQLALVTSMCQRVHLVSGETYTGKCEINPVADVLEVSTQEGRLTLPYWTIKRFVSFNPRGEINEQAQTIR
ncbi:hypothetical protein AMQ84_06535 [Paenibacillus riograndensis]|uniref:Uncharacterized protein n=1 Tax=Paenibacillus riograndensis TaxID=483937 RepID=A0A132U7W1_9BACL|nr:hypothetical protein [Paenibacillus riograndensis]KWX79568.1 hypothetical protein AMQ84_06535 [Paenibacillus riograndensis]